MGIRVENAAAPDVLEILVYDTIGEDFWTGEGLRAKDVHAALKSSKAKEIHLSVNSFGGDSFEGVAIYNLLRQRADKGTRITATVQGVAASAASVIVAAADYVEVPANAALMIHEASSYASGNARDLEERAKLLRQVNETIADTYVTSSSRRGFPLARESVLTMMTEETWMFGEDAVKQGFADVSTPALEAAASVDVSVVRRAIEARQRAANDSQEKPMNEEIVKMQAELADGRAALEKATADAVAAIELAQRAETEIKAREERIAQLEAERATVQALASEQAAALNLHAVQSLVGKKLYPAEVEAHAELRACNPGLFERLMSARPDLVILSNVTGTDLPENTLTTDPESKLAAIVRGA
jgi:ATP-dependent protease ClpP protease subunit